MMLDIATRIASVYIYAAVILGGTIITLGLLRLFLFMGQEATDAFYGLCDAWKDLRRGKTKRRGRDENDHQ